MNFVDRHHDVILRTIKYQVYSVIEVDQSEKCGHEIPFLAKGRQGNQSTMHAKKSQKKHTDRRFTALYEAYIFLLVSFHSYFSSVPPFLPTSQGSQTNLRPHRNLRYMLPSESNLTGKKKINRRSTYTYTPPIMITSKRGVKIETAPFRTYHKNNPIGHVLLLLLLISARTIGTLDRYRASYTPSYVCITLLLFCFVSLPSRSLRLFAFRSTSNQPRAYRYEYVVVIKLTRIIIIVHKNTSIFNQNKEKRNFVIDLSTNTPWSLYSK